jgi:hypothetical protein
LRPSPPGDEECEPAGKVERKHYYWGGRHPKDYLLAHNPVQPVHERQDHGVNGFRVMWIPPAWSNEKFKVCNCGWRPDLGVHYSAGRHRKISSIDFENDADAAEALEGVKFWQQQKGPKRTSRS